MQGFTIYNYLKKVGEKKMKTKYL